MVSENFKKKFSVQLALASIVFGCLFLLLSGHSSAQISGAKSNIHPDVVAPGYSAYVRAVVQLSPGGVWLKARSTVASIYVPEAVVNTAPGQSATINLTIKGGCDTGFWADGGVNGYAADTYFQVSAVSSYSGTSHVLTRRANVSSDAVCNAVPEASRGDFSMSFIATPPPVSPNSYDEFRHDGYYVYRFEAVGVGSESVRYMNNFRVQADTAGVYVGLAGWVGLCDISNYPNSCPPARPYTDIYGRSRGTNSFVYSSFYGSSGTTFGIDVYIKNRCTTTGKISLYDLDVPNVSQPGMTISLTKGSARSPVQTLPYVGIDRWEEGIPGFFSPHPGRGSYDNQYMDIPGGDPAFNDLGEFDLSQYNITLSGVDNDNAVQILAEVRTCSNPPPPVTCTGFRVVTGGSTFAPGSRITLEATIGATDGSFNTALNNMLAAPADTSGRELQAGIIGPVTTSGDSPGWNVDWSSPSYPTFLATDGRTLKVSPDANRTWGGLDQDSYALSGAENWEFTWPLDNFYYQRLGITSRTFQFSVVVPSVTGNHRVGIRLLDRYNRFGLGPWLDYNVGCTTTVRVGNFAPVASFDADCSVIRGLVTDQDYQSGGFRVHIRFGSTAAALTQEVFTDSAGNWSWTIPDSLKNETAQTIYISALGKNNAGVEDTWVQSVNNGLSIGPCLAISCSAIEYRIGSGAYTGTANGSTIIVNRGEQLGLKYTMLNSSPAVGGKTIANFSNANSDYAFGYANNFPASGTVNGFDIPTSSGPRLLPNGGITQIAPGETADFSYAIDTTSSAVNNYAVRMRMVQNFVAWRGEVCNLTIRVQQPPLACTVSFLPVSIEPNQRFRARVTLNNSDSAVMPVNSASFTSNPAGISGNAIRKIIGASTTPFLAGDSVPAASGGINGSMILESAEITVPVAGDYVVDWTVIFDGSRVANCPDTTANIRNKPYAKFYGNDVIAGGGFGTSCTVTGTNTNAIAHMSIDTANVFRGASAELAVFAVESVQGIRSAAARAPADYGELVFANTGTGVPDDPTTYLFGGSFGAKACTEDYWTNRAGSALVPSAIPPGATYPVVDLSSLATGNYIIEAGSLPLGKVSVYASSPLPNGRRITLYVDGDVIIGRETANDTSVTFASTSWTSRTQIPSLYLVTQGNIYIDDTITELNGVFIAQPNSSSPSNTGEIHTCSYYSANVDLTRFAGSVNVNIPPSTALNAGQILSRYCSNKLTVTGAFMAQRVHLLRNNGTVSAAANNEAYTSANIAEVFRFSPEMFLVSGNGTPPDSSNNAMQFDSILSLPPAF